MKVSTLIGYLGALFFFACCSSGDDIVASTSGPPRIDWIKSQSWQPHRGGGRGSLPIPHHVKKSFLRIGSDPAQEIHVECEGDDPQLATSDSAKLIAYRCNTKEAWRLIHTGTPPIADPVAVLGKNIEPHWKAAPDLTQSVLHVLDQQDVQVNVAAIIKRLGKEKGNDALVKVLGASASLNHQVWTETFDSLSEEHREKVRLRLTGTLARQPVSAELFYNTFYAFPENNHKLNAKLLGRCPDLFIKKTINTRKVTLEVARRVALSDQKKSGELICEMAREMHKGSLTTPDKRLDTLALMVLASTQVHCPDINSSHNNCAGVLSGRGCQKAGEPWKLCDPEELDQLIHRDFTSWLNGQWREKSSLRAGDYMLAIMRNHNNVPPELEKAAKWIRFNLEQPDEPSCSGAHIPGGTKGPCHCWPRSQGTYLHLGFDLCAASQSGVQPFYEALGGCFFRIDEKRQAIVVMGSDKSLKLTGIIGIE